MIINQRAIRLSKWIVSHLPMMLIKEPERVFISYLAVIIGTIMLIPYYHPPSIDKALGGIFSFIWASTFLIGGLAKLAGLFVTTDTLRPQTLDRIDVGRSLERLGASLIALATLIYAVVTLRENGLPALMTFMMFIGLSIVNTIRLVVSTAGHAELQERRI